MLLVHDHETELPEPHRLLHERVGPHRELRAAPGQALPRVPALLRAHRPGQQHRFEPRRLQQAHDVQKVLLRQQLGRRHHRGLQAVLHRDERGQQRHDGLAGADVPLQQAVHRPRPLQGLHDLLERLALVAGQPERQHVERGAADAIVDGDAVGLAQRVRFPPLQRQPQLEHEELLEDQPPLGRCPVLVEIVD